MHGGKNAVEIIASKRDGKELDGAEVRGFVDDFMRGDVTDYQMAAFLMAVYFRGMSGAETVALLEAMLYSGDVLDLSSVPGTKVDKHSTGGVGDKVSITLAPLVAACGVPVPMVSGRGLGHTGGTLDKLEAIPGFRTDLDAGAFARIVGDVGCCMIGQTAEIAPADKRLYALRDVTATVESIPLIVASILCKKLAEGIDALVLDVKVGRGAFMKDAAGARRLAEALVRVGTGAGKRVVALLTDMEGPLGRTIGNALETREAIAVLCGDGPADLVECTLALGAEMLVLGGKASDAVEGTARLRRAIASREGARVLERMIEAQGGDPRVVEEPARLVVSENAVALRREGGGEYVQRIDALELGLAAVSLGAGRTRADQPIDASVGITIDACVGDRVNDGGGFARVHLPRGDGGEAHAAAIERIRRAFVFAPEPPPRRSLVLGRVG